MSDRKDEKLEAMLRSRGIEPAGPELAERIVLKAQEIPQNEKISLIRWVRRVFAEFHLPKPAYVLACTLLLGLVVGFNMPPDVTSADPDTLQVHSFLYSDEGIL